jgi:hypothetical protein
VAADEGGGKPRGEAEQASEADDLDALAGGLASVAPSEGTDEAEVEAHDLAALGALAARTTLASPESDGTSLRLSATGANADATTDSELAPASADRAVRAPTASATKPPSPSANVAASSAATPAVAASDEHSRAALAAALTAPAMPARARAAWLMPLLVGIGVGVGIAGGMYGLAQRDAPQRDDTAPTAVPAAPASPVAASPQPSRAVQPSVEPPGTPPPATGTASAPDVAAPQPSQPSALAVPEQHAPTATARSAQSAPRVDVAPRAQAAAPADGTEPSMDLAPAASQPAEAAPDDPGPEPVAAAADKPAARAGTTMDALLDEALSPAARRNELEARQQAALAANTIPATPSRDEVTQAMTVLLPAIRGCAMGQSGLATAGIVVHSDGRVASVDVAGAPFAGSASGRCMEGVIRRARFPRFSQPSFRIKFPLAIQ